MKSMKYADIGGMTGDGTQSRGVSVVGGLDGIWEAAEGWHDKMADDHSSRRGSCL